MFILNKNNKQIQECHNSDVIKVCTKDAKNYAVAATKEELAAVAAGMAQIQPEMKQGEESINKEQKTDPEGTQEGQGGTSDGDAGAGKQEGTNDEGKGDEAGQDDWKALPEEEKLAALEAKKVDELRKIAKAEGIQGYGNMNKDTLVAMIMNH